MLQRIQEEIWVQRRYHCRCCCFAHFAWTIRVEFTTASSGLTTSSSPFSEKASVTWNLEDSKGTGRSWSWIGRQWLNGRFNDEKKVCFLLWKWTSLAFTSINFFANMQRRESDCKLLISIDALLSCYNLSMRLWMRHDMLGDCKCLLNITKSLER